MGWGRIKNRKKVLFLLFMPSIPGGSEYDKGSRAAAAEKAAVLIARRKLMTTNTIVKKAGMIFQTKKKHKKPRLCSQGDSELVLARGHSFLNFRAQRIAVK